MDKVLYIEPSATDLLVAHYQRLLDRAAYPGTQVDVIHLPLPGVSLKPTYWHAGFELEGQMYKKVKQAADLGYDAVIVGCSADPGLDVAKRLSTIPVIGPLEAGLHTAAMLAPRLMILTPGPHGAGPWEEIRWLEDRVRFYGLGHKIASIHRVDVGSPPPSELAARIPDEPDAVRELLLGCFQRAVSIPGPAADEIRKAIAGEGIGAVYFSCTLWAGMLEPLAKEFGIPMLDPVLSALRVAELLVRSV